jgi:ribulose-phosphate 3-epimerase
MNPATSLEVLDWANDNVDVLLVMSANLGFGGQTFIAASLRKLQAARRIIDREFAAFGRGIRLEVDGGIKVETIRRHAEAEVNTFVGGSAIFGRPSYREMIDEMRAALVGSLRQRTP